MTNKELAEYDIERLGKLRDAAPFGSWYSEANHPGIGAAVHRSNTIRQTNHPHRHVLAHPAYDQWSKKTAERAALLDYVAATHNALPDLIAALRVAWADNARLRERCERLERDLRCEREARNNLQT